MTDEFQEIQDKLKAAALYFADTVNTRYMIQIMVDKLGWMRVRHEITAEEHNAALKALHGDDQAALLDVLKKYGGMEEEE